MEELALGLSLFLEVYGVQVGYFALYVPIEDIDIDISVFISQCSQFIPILLLSL